jgi:hypothetical protein
MTPFVTTALASGAVLALAAAALAAPGAGRRLDRFPRHRFAGGALAALALCWAGWIVYHGELGRFAPWRPAVFAAVPLGWFFLYRYLDELLAPRALGGLLLLAAHPALAAARLSDAPFRAALSVTAYAAVVAGLALMMGPYRFRRAARALTATAARRRAGASVAAAWSALLFAAAFAGRP